MPDPTTANDLANDLSNQSRVVASPFPRALERHLAEALREIKQRDPLAPILIVAPSVLLLDRLKRVLAAELGAVLNVAFFYHRRLAEEALGDSAESGKLPLRVASDEILARLLSGVLAQDRGPLARYACDWRGGPAALLATLRDLRDAGVTPEALETAGTTSPKDADLTGILPIYRAYVASLVNLAAQGLTDAAGLMEAALPKVAAWGARFEQVFHHGAYDLIGLHGELMRVLATRVPVTWLVPAHPEAPAFEMGRRFIARLGATDKPDWIADGAPANSPSSRAAAIYDEESRFENALPEIALDLFHAQGARSEADHAAALALTAVGNDGVAPQDVAIVARDTTTYAPLVLQALRTRGLPVRVGAVRPLSAEPVAQAFLFLLRVLYRDLDRQSVVDLCRSPSFTIPHDPSDLPVVLAPDLWDRWSRAAGVIRGHEMWLEGISTWLQERRAARRDTDGDTGPEENRVHRDLERVLEALADARKEWFAVPGKWREQAEVIRGIAVRFFPLCGDREIPAASAINDLLDDLARIDTVSALMAGLPGSPRAVFEHLEEAVGAASLPPPDRDAAGVRVIDFMQARAVPFRRVILIGFNQSLFPRKQREDPFLTDKARSLLREQSGKPVPVKLEGDSEERMLLALLVAGAEERLSIGWQRADADGKARSPSLALREIARVRYGEPRLDRILEDSEGALRLRSHPLEALAQSAELRQGLSARDAFVAAGLGYCGGGSAPGEGLRMLRDALGRTDEAVLGGLGLIGRIDAWSDADLGCDGVTGAIARDLLPAKLSVSAFNQLGGCPLSFFFRRILNVREMDEVTGESELEPYEMGELAHALLFRVYSQLADERLFGSDGGRLVARGLSLLETHWGETFDGPARRIGRFLPVLWEVLSGRWRSDVEAFLRADLAALAADGGEPFAFEQTLEEEIDLPGPSGPIRLAIIGRVDRMVRYAGGLYRVGDYKTRGNPWRRVDLKSMLQGSEVQIPLYTIAAESRLRRESESCERVEGEILGFGPHVSEGNGFAEAGPAAPEGKKYRAALPGVKETLGVLVDEAQQGRFPMSPGTRCGYCAYVGACRRTHPPSLARVESAQALAGYRAIWGKTTKAPLLAAAAKLGPGKKKS